MSAYHLHRSMNPIRWLQTSGMPAASLALRACVAPRVTTPAASFETKGCDSKRRDRKWEVDSKAEVDGS